MGRLYAIADLHLSLSGEKPMDVFGDLWTDHATRMAEAWDRVVEDGDTVLLPGDLSWAKTLPEAAEDLAWIGRRRGRKILLRGNHDYWWGSLAKVRAALPDGCDALQNQAFCIDDRVVVVGARGWTDPSDPIARPEDRKIFVRELERLNLSVADADRRFPRDLPRVAMVHYPPWIRGREPSSVVGVLREAGVGVCVFGHLHGEDHGLAVTGTEGGIRFMLIAADAVGFEPVEVET
jgi:predicted phosphohydrolase